MQMFIFEKLNIQNGSGQWNRDGAFFAFNR